jgi:hypothetical protein
MKTVSGSVGEPVRGMSRAKPRRREEEPVKLLFLDSSTYVQHSNGRHVYRCARAGCKRDALKNLEPLLYQCRDCGQRWRVEA